MSEPPGFQGSGELCSLPDYNTASARVSYCSSTPIYVHLSVRHTRSYDLDQRSFENRNTKWEAEGSGSHSSSARAHSCGHMACARVKHKWEPAGAPSPPSHSEREPSKLKQHSVTNRNVNSRCVEVLGFWIMFSPFLCMPVLGGVTWVFLYPDAKIYT